ncbi:head-tail connector protein [Parasedimentitalea psychrophila]|uniref:Uncharacterized protein n=1 Tax=Parasedimentitalea psychrophila TaxID=2997337 RepID=A0A9Y2KVW1_9RHOB|nr:hypothetical protein [Parasedimentitalea psychrophila]WIY23638.1 hypothetical protein QPJ95_13370 [Parasedimentitalea psychrophila]
MSFVVSVPPAAEIFTAADLPSDLDLGVDETNFDTQIAGNISAAWATAENYMRKRLLAQPLVATFCGFGRSGRLAAPIVLVQSISKSEYRTSGGDWRKIPSSEVGAYLADQPGHLMPAAGYS